MNIRINAFLLALFMLLILIATASAQVQRTFVSGVGSDSNVCTRTAPCRTFTQALMGTSPGGEVVVLDSAGYGAFAITQAVSITAPPGVYAGISVFSGIGISINAGASDTVVLRGLTVNNQGSSGSGIVCGAAGTLHIEGCVVNGFSAGAGSFGIDFEAVGKLEVKDSIIRGNDVGLHINSGGAGAHATVDQVRMEENVSGGLVVVPTSTVTVRNSVASGNGGSGFAAISGSSTGVEMNIENCTASNNATGISAAQLSSGAVTVRVSNSTVTDNGTGLSNSGGTFLSRSNNTVEGNTTNTSGTIGSYAAK